MHTWYKVVKYPLTTKWQQHKFEGGQWSGNIGNKSFIAR